MRKEITGTLHHIAFGNKRLVKGWYAIKDGSGQTYLLEKSFALVSPLKVNLYAVEGQLESYIVSHGDGQFIKDKKGFQLGGLGLALALGAILRHLIPMELVFGPSNRHLDWGTGLYQIGWLLLVLTLSIWSLYAFRKYRIKTKLSRLERLGRVRVTSSTLGLRMGVSLGVKGWLIYALVFIVTILPIFVLAFLVELRLFMIFPVLWTIYLFYRGLSIGEDNQVEVVWKDKG